MINYLKKVSRHETLTEDEAYSVMEMIYAGNVCDNQLSAFLAILQTRGEAEAEIMGFAMYLKSAIATAPTSNDIILDTCGTGGDYANTFNISTASALVVSSAGIKVAKHGGRSVSSLSGSMDVLEALGIKPHSNIQAATHALHHVAFTFLSSADFYTGLNRIKRLRKQLGIRTCFNILGPVLNPMNVKHQVLGVYDEKLLLPIARILRKLGSHEAMVVYAKDGLDEISITAPTQVAHLKDNKIIQYTIDPRIYGMSSGSNASIRGGNAITNASIIKKIFSADNSHYRDSVIINAAAGFVVTNRVDTLKSGIALAKELIDSGQCSHQLQHIIDYHHEVSL